MRETEITVQVFQTKEELDTILKAQGFAVTRKFDLIDYYFSKYTQKELGAFEYKDLIANSFLLRRIAGDKTTDFLSYKKKQVDENGVVIAEEKFKCEIENLEDAIKIFNSAGIDCWCNLVQHLIIYQKEKSEFAVQVVDGLGVFIEYEEDETMAHLENEYQKIEEMVKRLKNLGLKLGDDYSCKKVFMKFKKEECLMGCTPKIGQL